MPSPTVAHGQRLLWSDDIDTGVQGVTELEECERTQDLWLRSVQDELRRGQLTEETHTHSYIENLQCNQVVT